MNSIEKVILLDADVVSHFIKSGNTLILPKIFSHKKAILNVVLNEVRRHPKLAPQIDFLIRTKSILELEFSNDKEVILEFARLRAEGKHDGEAACMATARYNKNIIASNNFRDIRQYCEIHSITYYSTLDMIYQAFISDLMTLAECDQMIHYLLSAANPARLRYKSIAEYCEAKQLPVPSSKSKTA